MKFHKKRIRVLRRLALAGCLAALAVPVTAAAKPVPADPPVSADSATTTDPATAVRHENGYATLPQHSYSLPSGFHTETQVASRAPAAPFALAAGFRPEGQRSTPSNPPSSTPSPVIREIRTVTNDAGHTLAIVLASIALAIALGSAAYGVVRLTRMQRRLVGS